MKFTHRQLGLGLVLLGIAGPAAAQQVAPPNIHILLDTSGSMRELPQVQNSNHVEFFNITTNGCENPRLDAMEASRGWDPNTVYPVPDPGTGLGSDTGFPYLFMDDKIYSYMYWADLTSPPYSYDAKELGCQAQIGPGWSSTDAAAYDQCVTCLATKGYWKLNGANGLNSNPNSSRFLFTGRFLNFNPPKYVAAKAVVKSVLSGLQSTRVGLSTFSGSGYSTTMLESQHASCSASLGSPSAFDSFRASYVNAVNGVAFNTSTPLAKSLLNLGYYFTSGDSIYQTTFGFGTSYSYPAAFKNAPLTSDDRSVCWSCQTNAVIIITDGEPNTDNISSTLAANLRAVNGGPTYCPDTLPCGTSSSADHGSNLGSYTDDNPNYYLDDVAKMLYEQDLQSNTPAQVGDFDTTGQQNVRTYTVGFGIDSNLLRNTAAVGGGLYFTATDGPSLQQALQAITADVQTHAASCTY